eukprot:755861-Hanusia_phi.AAC.5
MGENEGVSTGKGGYICQGGDMRCTPSHEPPPHQSRRLSMIVSGTPTWGIGGRLRGRISRVGPIGHRNRIFTGGWSKLGRRGIEKDLEALT